MHTVEVSVLTNVDPTKTNRVRVLEEQAVDRNVNLPPYLLVILRLPGASYLTLTLRLLLPSAQSSRCLWALPWCLHRHTKLLLNGSTTMIYSVVITTSEVLVLFRWRIKVIFKRPLSLIFKVASKRKIGETTADIKNYGTFSCICLCQEIERRTDFYTLLVHAYTKLFLVNCLATLWTMMIR